MRSSTAQTNGHYLDDERFLPFWERVQELDVPVYLHPGELPDQPAMFAGRPQLDGPVWAWTADTGGHALRLTSSGGTFKRFPRLKVILGDTGETLPYLLWRIDDRYALQTGGTLVPPDARPSFFFRRNFVITTSGVLDANPLADAIAALGEDNVLVFGRLSLSRLKQSGDFLDNAPLSDAVRAKICSGNAKRVLHL